MTRFLAGVRETFVRVLSDRSAITTLIGAAVLYSFFYPSPYREEVASQIPAVLVDLDRSPMSRALVRKVLAVRAVRVTASVNSLSESKTMIDDGRAHAIMVISADFQRDIMRGGRGRVALFGNGAFLSHASTALSGLGDAVAAFGQDAALAQAQFAGTPAAAPFRLVQRPLFNTREGYGSTVVPAVAVVIIHQTLLLGIGLLVGTLREGGRSLALSRPRLLGIIAAFGVIGLVNVFYYSGLVFWLQDFPRGGNLVGLVVTAVVFVAAVVPLGLLVGSFFPTRERAFQIIGIFSLPMFFLANVSWPKPASPPLLTWIAKLLPTTPGINAMIKFNQLGAELSEALPELLNLIMLVVVYGTLVLWRYRSAANPHPTD